MDTSTQPAIVIAGADPDWAFTLQGRLRTVIGWSYDILITFTAHQALDYVLRRSATLLISGPRMGRRAHLMDAPELLAAVSERAPATRVLLARDESHSDETFTAACQLIGVPIEAEPPA